MATIWTRNGKRFNIEKRFTDAELGVKQLDMSDPANRERCGVVETTIIDPPEGYSEETHYRGEQDTAPYVVYERKPQRIIDEAFNGRVQAQIDALERGAMLPRVVREDLMGRFLTAAVGQGLTETQLLDPLDPAYAPGFAKVYAFNEEIKALRNSLRAISNEEAAP